MISPNTRQGNWCTLVISFSCIYFWIIRLNGRYDFLYACLKSKNKATNQDYKKTSELHYQASCVASSKPWHLSPPSSSSSVLGFMISPPLVYYHSTFCIFRTPMCSQHWDMVPWSRIFQPPCWSDQSMELPCLPPKFVSDCQINIYRGCRWSKANLQVLFLGLVLL